MTPRGTGAHGSRARVSVAQATAGRGGVPPSRLGPQVRVQRRGVAPCAVATVMVSDDAGFDPAEPGPDALPGAAWLPHAAASATAAPRTAATPALRRTTAGGAKV